VTPQRLSEADSRLICGDEAMDDCPPSCSELRLQMRLHPSALEVLMSGIL